jgi:hypothetical protein
MAKKAASVKKPGVTRNWIAYLCESLVTSGVMPTWEAATYLTENLFGESPNPRLLGTSNAYEVTSQFLHRMYQPLAEAASREVTLPQGAMLHFPGEGQSHQLVMLDAAKAWDLVFQDSDTFNRWAEDRFRLLKSALTAAIGKPARQPLLAEVAEVS